MDMIFEPFLQLINRTGPNPSSCLANYETLGTEIVGIDQAGEQHPRKEGG
jgi:hypothetical protein